MILTIQEFNREKGTDLPMFSRTGKSTISYYQAFNQKSREQAGPVRGCHDGLDLLGEEDPNEIQFAS
jgi:hypothetical protein